MNGVLGLESLAGNLSRNGRLFAFLDPGSLKKSPGESGNGHIFILESER